jgi:Flp pilus assembly protein TadG
MKKEIDVNERNPTRLTHRRRGTTATGHGRPGERGYVLLLTALILPALMLMAAFAVDLGSWYARAAQLQRGADAAALAGVVWMPNDFDKAEDEAIAAATRNGLVDGQNNVTVTVSRVPNESQQLQVTIVDSDVEAYFGQVVLDHITLRRSATARFVLPIPLGSPLSSFGNQGVPPNTNVTDTYPQFWAAINPPYTAKANGDAYATKCTTIASTNDVARCATTNSEYRKSGYLYAVTVPQSAVTLGQKLTVQIFDAPFNTEGTFNGTGTVTGEGNIEVNDSTGPTITYELYAADTTPLDNSDNPSTAGTCSTGPGLLSAAKVATPNNAWTTVCEITVTRAGVFPLRVKSSDNVPAPGVDAGEGSAHYAVRAKLGTQPFGTTNWTTTQPRIYALNDMSIFTGGVASNSSFYLAEVESVYAGKSLTIDLYDPGDGSAGNFDLSILQPNGTTAQCSYSSPSGVMGAVGACKIRTRSTASTPANRYGGLWLKIVVRLASNYTCTTGACWWKVKYEYTSGAQPTDRTVWRANITGDPVGLVK